MKINRLNDLDCTILCSPTPVTQLLLDNCTEIKDTNVWFKNSDIDLLFNQQRLENLGIDQINNWLSSLSSSQSSAIKGKFSDDELIALCKSRHIQSPQELLNWSQYLTSQYENIKLDEQEQQEQQEQQDIKDTTIAPDTSSSVYDND